MENDTGIEVIEATDGEAFWRAWFKRATVEYNRTYGGKRVTYPFWRDTHGTYLYGAT
jgi:hypothetical protein